MFKAFEKTLSENPETLYYRAYEEFLNPTISLTGSMPYTHKKKSVAQNKRRAKAKRAKQARKRNRA